MGVWFCTREDVASALDVKSTARDAAQIDRLIESKSRDIEDFLNRPTIAPTLATRYKDWPSTQFGRSWRVWLDQDEVISLTQVLSGGAVIVPADYFLEPANEGPPFNHIEIDLSSQASFSAQQTPQRSLALTGLFGHSDEQTPAGTLAGGINDTVTTLAVSDGSLVGVGSLLSIGTERVTVTGRAMVTTAQTLQTPLTASNANDQVAVTTGTAYHPGEVILLDSERMLIVDIAGNTLTVKRAWDGTVLAAHTGSTIYASRQLTVARHALGTTAASHLNGDVVTAWVTPGPVRELTIGETINALQQETAGFARSIGSGESVRNASGAGLADLRDRVYGSHGRKARSRAV